jgi:ribose transport system permease protein
MTALRAPAFVPRRVASRHGWTIGVYVLMVALLIVEVIVAPVFTSFDLSSLVIGTLPLAFAAMAQAVIVISGGIDLSIGAIMALVNVISARMMENAGMGSAIGIALMLMALGVVVGMATGTAITISGVPDIVVTLATSFIWAGLALVIMPTPGGGAPDDFQRLTQGIFGWEWIPSGLVVLAVVGVVVWLPLRWRRVGFAIYAVGSNREAAYLSGVRVAPTRILAYAIGGFFAALGGLALTSTTGTGSAVSGEFYTLNSVAAVVLGGVSLLGGKGGVAGPVAAAFVLTIIVAIMVFLGIDPNYGQVVQGGLIVLVVMIGGLVLLRRRA